MIFTATIGGMLALLFWGVSDYLAGKSGKTADEYLTNFVIQAVGAVMLFPVVMYYGLSVEFSNALIPVILIAALFTIAYISFVKALTIGPFGVAVPIANAYTLVTMAIGLLFFNFQISVLELLVLVIIILGVIFLAVDKTTFSVKNFRGSTVYFSLVTLLCWGVAFALIDVTAKIFSWHALLFMIAIIMSILGFLCYVIARKRLPSVKEMHYTNMKYSWWAGVFITLGAIAFYVSVDITGSVVIPAVIASASPVVTSFCAYYWDKEKLDIFKRVGAVFVVAGIMLLNLL